MAFYDWNHDGKKDFADNYLEYNIYKESTKNSGSRILIQRNYLKMQSLVFIQLQIFMQQMELFYSKQEIS